MAIFEIVVQGGVMNCIILKVAVHKWGGKNIENNLKFNEIASSAPKGSKQIIELSQHTNTL